MQNSEIHQIRHKIDQIDDDVLGLLARRKKLVKQIATLKKTVVDKNREEQIISKVKYQAHIHDLNEKLVTNIFELIIINSRAEQKK